MPIRVLQPHVVAKIAAGEVVERPASVVKELVENSLDAGASHITVEVEAGGVNMVRVSDDGHGIAPAEMTLAFQRHATSKIADFDDLESVTTLGFRGEALPSIAAVSRVNLFSRTADSDVGQELQARWGETSPPAPAGGPVGTTITVSDLFDNVPARRKYLRSAGAEASRIADLITRLALAFPEVQFRLRQDGRETLLSLGNGSGSDALVAVYGAQVAEGMLRAEYKLEDEDYSIAGYVSAPSLHRANRTYMTFLVNRRLVQSRTLSYALEEAYQGFLPQRRYPIAVLSLQVPPHQVDVNVHPAKREVRFTHEGRAFSLIQRAVREALVGSSPIPEVRFEDFMSPSSSGETARAMAFFPMAGPVGASDASHFPGTLEGSGPARDMRTHLPLLRVVGQVQDTYVVAEGPDGLYLLDQHAAHERVVYDRLIAGSGSGRQPRPLLQPQPAELTPSQEEMMRTHGDLLNQYGFIIEPFGDRSYLVRAVPEVASGADPAKALVEVLDLAALQGGLRDREEAVTASIACHSAVRAGQRLTQQEMEELVTQLDQADNPHTCPHGRPTMVHLSAHHLEREFGRR